MIAGLSLPALAQQQTDGRPGLSPLTRQYLSELKKPGKGDLLPEGYIYRKGADGKTYISALVRVADEGKAAEI